MAPPLEKQGSEVDDEDSPDHLKRFLKLAGSALKGIYNTAFKPDRVHVFFLWSTAMFALCCLMVLVGKDGAQLFFCQVDIRNETQGCAQCPDKSLLCLKPSMCWRHAMNITIQVNATTTAHNLYQTYQEAVSDVACVEAIEKEATIDALKLIREFARNSGLYTGSSSCKKFHCAVLANVVSGATFADDLISPDGVCTNIKDTKADEEATVCPCNDILQYDRFNSYDVSLPAPATATALAAAVAAGTPVKSTYIKAIASVCPDVFEKMESMCTNARWQTGNYPVWCASTTTTTTVSTTTSSTVSTTTNATGRRLDLDAGSSDTLIDALDALPVRSTEKRKLQDAAAEEVSAAAPSPTPPTPPAGTALPSYQTGEWGSCKCYQQCQPGVRTRKVECEAAACAAPEPPTRQNCYCGHCAMCDLVPLLGMQMLIYAVQTLLGFLCFLLYVTGSENEQDFIELGRIQKLKGFFHKKFPSLLRMLVIVQMVLVGFVAFSTFAATYLREYLGDYQKDCYASAHMHLVAMMISFVWLAQVLFGNASKRMSKVPDWLVAPAPNNSPAIIKYARTFLRALGP